MLRRSTATSQLELRRPTAGATRAFFDSLKKQFGAPAGSSAVGDQHPSQTPSGLPSGFNAQQMQTLQQLFSSQPKEKQEQLMRQAMEVHKVMSKVPGIGKLAQKNAAMLEQMLKMQSAASATASPQSAGAPAAPAAAHNGGHQPTAASAPRRDIFREAANGQAGSSRSGPSLDDLKKVNLGPEIEALFEELRTIRKRKNEYRDMYYTARTSLQELQKQHNDLVAREANVRSKLTKAEQDVMLLTSENMELRDHNKAMKKLAQTNKQLQHEVGLLKSAAQASAAPGTASYTALKQQQQATEDALRSLQRKVERMRRRDPLLQFSLACSDVSRMCTAIRTDESAGSGAAAAGSSSGGSLVKDAPSEAGQEAAEQAFADLQSIYHRRQQEAWAAAAHEHGAAARAFVAVVRRYVMARVRHANYDAVVSFTGDVTALSEVFAGVGFTVEAVPGEGNKAHVVAAADAGPLTDQPGPYGYALALRASAAGGPAEGNGRFDRDAKHRSGSAAFAVTGAHPFVSSTLVHNAKRSSVHYETARASGPGGQATNVTETQVYAKLRIDGEPAFTAEAQDSRSALNNKEVALEKLQQQRRLHYNDALAKQERADALLAQLVDAMRSQGGLTLDEEVLLLVQEAATAKEITSGDEALVKMLQELSRSAASAA
ncbi:hypothetical protein ABL78_7179 [Leptomonas seymouri]|uniref:Prokaryotic-type class I peptide chain release factors domain-containing protein n=1 Tax=Leptomonas seymouri TaxID=5684 RepID=A0A0N0P368_LEPSE|nr:hypothetical protein ABL78_7179 [Leptomonas seymouri]|eukprot:KPI83779.1 hypothetical protein ABL78_7179 [Leptomonas seymouri]